MAQPQNAIGKTKEERMNDYDSFVEKFKPKKTTDDCYTPTVVYDAVANYVAEHYGVDKSQFVRPFMPGGDYENYDYPDGCIVVDNPPFSILSKIFEFYIEKGIKFFLFAPTLTLFSGKKTTLLRENILTDCTIEYENGAKVKTSFVANMGSNIVARTAIDLQAAVTAAVKSLHEEKKAAKQLPKYEYPDEVVTAAEMMTFAKHGVDFNVSAGECVYVGGLDSQKEMRKGAFGGCLLISKAKAKAKVEAKVEAKAKAVRWELSDREREIVESLGHVQR